MIFSLLQSFHIKFENEVHRMMQAIIDTHLQLQHQVAVKCSSTEDLSTKPAPQWHPSSSIALQAMSGKCQTLKVR